jgi:hypothetical protein
MRDVVEPDTLSTANVIPAMSESALAQVRALESLAACQPQQAIDTAHLFHAGLYARTIRIPAGVMITGALIKIPTVLIVSGAVVIYLDGAARELHGYHVFAASAGRKQAFLALADTDMTMLFPTAAKTIEAAERAFTDETDLLVSRRDTSLNTITVTED